MNLSAVSGDSGEYMIQFTGLDVDKNVTLEIKKTKYKTEKQLVPLKIGAITQADIVMLTKRT
jgi:hypothetical protein